VGQAFRRLYGGGRVADRIFGYARSDRVVIYQASTPIFGYLVGYSQLYLAL